MLIVISKICTEIKQSITLILSQKPICVSTLNIGGNNHIYCDKMYIYVPMESF